MSEVAIAEVARDLVELCRVAEAIELLDRELPKRYDVECPSCGAWKDGSPCREPGWMPCWSCKSIGVRYGRRLYSINGETSHGWLACSECSGRGWQMRLVAMVVPHDARVRAIGARP